MAAQVSQDAFRAADDGQMRQATSVAAPFATVAGVPVRLESPVHTHLLDNTTFTADSRHLTIDMDGFVLIEVMTDASDEDVLGLLAGLSMDPIQDILPVATEGYQPRAAATLSDPAVAQSARGG